MCGNSESHCRRAIAYDEVARVCRDHDGLCCARRVRRPGTLPRRTAAPRMSTHVRRARLSVRVARRVAHVDHNVLPTARPQGADPPADVSCLLDLRRPRSDGIFSIFFQRPTQRVRLQDTYQRMSHTNASAICGLMWLAAVHSGYPGSIVSSFSLFWFSLIDRTLVTLSSEEKMFEEN